MVEGRRSGQIGAARDSTRVQLGLGPVESRDVGARPGSVDRVLAGLEPLAVVDKVLHSRKSGAQVSRVGLGPLQVDVGPSSGIGEGHPFLQLDVRLQLVLLQLWQLLLQLLLLRRGLIVVTVVKLRRIPLLHLLLMLLLLEVVFEIGVLRHRLGPHVQVFHLTPVHDGRGFGVVAVVAAVRVVVLVSDMLLAGANPEEFVFRSSQQHGSRET